MESQQVQIIAEALGAALLGGIIGFERETAHKPAGLRTYMLISTSASLIVNFATLFVSRFEGAAHVTIDPLRAIEAIIAAVGFIGGGMLIRSKGSDDVLNLTTAALTLFAAAVGISVALKLYILSVFLTAFSLIVSAALPRFEQALSDSLSRK